MIKIELKEEERVAVTVQHLHFMRLSVAAENKSSWLEESHCCVLAAQDKCDKSFLIGHDAGPEYIYGHG